MDEVVDWHAFVERFVLSRSMTLNIRKDEGQDIDPDSWIKEMQRKDSPRLRVPILALEQAPQSGVRDHHVDVLSGRVSSSRDKTREGACTFEKCPWNGSK
eukprot:gnl/MRDRNA2_/MRDRNA2_206276_c0_seq1.p2 gnl/MRDRNA2_/MRDRNA2_206276_c0~~gnl/MRDRNA2_/MRDRNA2_206276_c0_seq1.p2  ORF type:complete len:100 (-),score=10.85 gnl/MRDRNA2_/MRDRNA2_206276_c0_seq1:149-448(-)